MRARLLVINYFPFYSGNSLGLSVLARALKENNSTKIQKISEDELGYISAICLDPGVGSRTREAMRESMAERMRWVRRMMAKGLEVFVALEKPRQESARARHKTYPIYCTILFSNSHPLALEG